MPNVDVSFFREGEKDGVGREGSGKRGRDNLKQALHWEPEIMT